MSPTKIANAHISLLSIETQEKIEAVGAKAQELVDLIDSLRTPADPVLNDDDTPLTMDGNAIVIQSFDRELNIAVERIEEAVMWTAKHLAN